MGLNNTYYIVTHIEDGILNGSWLFHLRTKAELFGAKMFQSLKNDMGDCDYLALERVVVDSSEQSERICQWDIDTEDEDEESNPDSTQ